MSRHYQGPQVTLIRAVAVLAVLLPPFVVALPPPISPASETLSENTDVELFSLPQVVLTKADLQEPKSVLEPYKIALPNDVSITPDTNGNWKELDDGTKVWRLRVEAPGATGIIVGFSKYQMPHGGQLFVYASDGSLWLPPFSSAHNNPTRQLWLPMFPKNDVVLEVNLPPSVKKKHLKLKIGAINSGFRSIPSQERNLQEARELGSGSCNVDVACPNGDDWQQEVRAVGAFSFTPTPNRGSLYCSGTMINNVLQNRRNFYLTAHHCLSDKQAAKTMTFYWNFETTKCGGTPDGSFDDFTTGGAVLRATYKDTDFTLLELNSSPDPSFGVTYAGWDRTGKDAKSAVGIHHPRGCEKRISFEDDKTITTGRFRYSQDPNGSYIRVIDWDLGTTEPGSSGSPLFNQDHKVIGQLLGGSAACGNDKSDWYGKFSKSWQGGGSPGTRLSDWLDPKSTGVFTLNVLANRVGSPRLLPTPFPTREPTTAPSDVPTPLPSLSPSKTPSLDCTNNPNWYFLNRKGKKLKCSWVAKKRNKRCRRNGYNGKNNKRMKAAIGCPAVCNKAC